MAHDLVHLEKVLEQYKYHAPSCDPDFIDYCLFYYFVLLDCIPVELHINICLRGGIAQLVSRLPLNLMTWVRMPVGASLGSPNACMKERGRYYQL